MKMGIRYSFITLSLSSLLMLSACGGGDDAPPPPPSLTSPPSPVIDAHYFVGNTKASGKELWKSDGTVDGTVLVKEINNDSDSSFPSGFIEVGSTVYFTADDGVNGRELWKTDASGTSMVKDINPNGSSSPSEMVADSGADKLYFIVNNDGSATQSLWESNGTDEGTLKIGTFSGVTNLTLSPSDNALFFTTATNSVLWRYDGEIVPTTPVASGLFTGATELIVVNGNLYFIAIDSDIVTPLGAELWTSNGIDTTIMVSDLCVGVCSSMNLTYSRLYNVNNALFFVRYDTRNIYTLIEGVPVILRDANSAPISMYTSSNDAVVHDGKFYFHKSDRALWRTDGTPDNTFRLSAGVISRPYDFQTADNGNVYFRVSNRLWVTNGTQAGTSEFYQSFETYKVNTSGSLVYLYKEVRNEDREQYEVVAISTNGFKQATKIVGHNDYRRPTMYSGQDKFYLGFDDDIHGNELWGSDGTIEGTSLLADIDPRRSGSSFPSGGVEFNGEIYFIATDNDGYGLWKSNGTDEGTVRLANNLDSIGNLVVSGGKVFFVGYDNTHGNELWVTDGTRAGTHMLVDLNPGSDGSNPYSLTDANGTLFFVTDEYGLWKTNGTEAGTLPVRNIYPNNGLIAVGDKIYFVSGESYDEDYGDELWVSNGTYAGTKMVKDINPGVASGMGGSAFKVIGNILYFAADDGTNGIELWRTDGTEEATNLVIDLNTLANGLDFGSQNFFVAEELLYFMAFNDSSELELWKTDGTAEGTIILTSLNQSGGYVDYEQGFEFYNGELYFSASNGADGLELWKSDGSVDGAQIVKNINEIASSSPDGFSVFNNMLFFIADNGINGRELWISNGSDEGTVMVKDVDEGIDNGSSTLLETSGESFRARRVLRVE